MQTTTTSTEASTVKVTRKLQRNARAWENLGVKFRRDESIGFSLDGRHSEPRLEWSAWHKAIYLTGGGSEIEDVVEYMNKYQERYLSIIAKRNARK
jgi:hypothetical protein